MLPHIGGAATERTRGRKANRHNAAVEYTRMVDPTVMNDLRQAKAVSLTGLSKQQRTPRFKRFINTAPLDRFLLVRDCFGLSGLSVARSSPPSWSAVLDSRSVSWLTGAARRSAKLTLI